MLTGQRSVSEASADIAPNSVAPEDELRAQVYRLLAGLLGSAPTPEALRAVAALQGDETTLGKTVSQLAGAAAVARPEQLMSEYLELFIGLGRGELVPYASFYLTGFLHEKPLARLRQDMDRLGVERNEGVAEPEDHIASVLEMMAGLAEGSLVPDEGEAGQRKFYDAHVGSWAPYFFRDLAATRLSPFYAAVGAVGAEFMAIEQRAFEMV